MSLPCRTLPTAPAAPPTALDAFGHASVALRPRDGRILWQTPLARQLMARHFNQRVPQQGPAHAPPALGDWVRACAAAGDPPALPPGPWTWTTGPHRLTCTLHAAGGPDEWLVVLTESTPAEGSQRPGDAPFTDLYPAPKPR